MPRRPYRKGGATCSGPAIFSGGGTASGGVSGTLRGITDTTAWGPLAALIGTWEGDEGLDISYHNAHGQVRETPYREHVTMDPFGPVANGLQLLYGLDYRMAACRKGEDSPFHTEIGYWLWDAEDGHVIRCFMVPRGTALARGRQRHGQRIVPQGRFDTAGAKRRIGACRCGP